MKKTIALLLAAMLALLALTSCSGGDDVTPPTAPINWCSYKTSRNTSGRDISYVKITFKDYGEITLLLDATTAPQTVSNFKKLVSDGFYNGLTIHRVQDALIQGGDPNANGSGNSGETIKGEFSSNGYESNDIKHLRGVISMARGKGADSASCQFFICAEDLPSLDGDYAAFGYVVDGLDVVDKITAKCTQYGGYMGTITTKALQPVIEKIEIINK